MSQHAKTPREHAGDHKPRIAFLDVGSGQTLKLLDFERPANVDVRFSRDGKGIVYSVSEHGVDNLWLQPLDGSKGRPLTNFAAEEIGKSFHWSPDGRYIAALKVGAQPLMLYDFSTQKWTEACGAEVNYPIWSKDGKYLYFEYSPQQQAFGFLGYQIVRLRMSDHKLEIVAGLEMVGRLPTGTFGAWFGLGPDDSPLIRRL